MIKKPKVYAVVTCYNQGEVIAETLDSLLQQSYRNLSVLVVDDGSTDPVTLACLERYQHQNPRAVQVIHKPNGHVASARNLGIRLSESDYVFISDGDDIYDRTLIEKLVAVLDQDPHAGVASSWIQTFGLAEWIVKPQGGSVSDFLHKNNCPAQALIRKQCWLDASGYDETMKQGYEDWDFYLAVTEQGWRIAIVPEPLIHYRVADVSLNLTAYQRRLQLISAMIRKHESTYHQYLVDVLLDKERALQEKNLQLYDLVLSPDDIPDVSFGDGGIAFAVQLMSKFGH